MRLSVSPSLTNQGELNWDPLLCPHPFSLAQWPGVHRALCQMGGGEQFPPKPPACTESIVN